MSEKVNPSVQTIKSSLEQLNQKYEGSRCFIMGNGPSLNEMNLEYLKTDLVFTANRCFPIFDRVSWRPAFYVVRDPNVVRNSSKLLQAKIEEFSDTLFFVPRWAIEENLVPENKNVIRFEEIEHGPDGLSSDPLIGLTVTRTVTVSSLQLAFFLGFNLIYLIGCDTNYSYGRPDAEKNKDHFDPNYLAGSDKWTVPDVGGILKDYILANETAQRLGIKVFNAGIGGSLEVFPRIKFESLFLKKKSANKTD